MKNEYFEVMLLILEKKQPAPINTRLYSTTTHKIVVYDCYYCYGS